MFGNVVWVFLIFGLFYCCYKVDEGFGGELFRGYFNVGVIKGKLV